MRTKSSIEDLYESTILKILVKKFQCTNQQQRWGCQCNNKFNGNWCQLHRFVGKASTCLPFLLIKFALLIQHRLLFNADSWGGILHKRGTCFWWPLEKRTSQLKPWNWVSVDSNLQSSDPCSLPPDPWESQAGTRSPIPGVSWSDQSRLLSRGPESMLNLLSCWEMEGEWTYWTALHYSEKGTYFRDQVHKGPFSGHYLFFRAPIFCRNCFLHIVLIHANSVCIQTPVTDQWSVTIDLSLMSRFLHYYCRYFCFLLLLVYLNF